jgi:alkanesulfonate monooxygenase SsuD/methylene tetrahydromethanopterin reductase-like flavin-dependent oxidoreductase (luciferase family)
MGERKETQMSVLTDIAVQFITAESDEAALKVAETHRVGRVRNGLRQLALRLERADEQALANEVWALRESLTAEVEREAVVAFTPDVEFPVKNAA